MRDETDTFISQRVVDMAKQENGFLDAHSHPFIADLRPSEADRAVSNKDEDYYKSIFGDVDEN